MPIRLTRALPSASLLSRSLGALLAAAALAGAPGCSSTDPATKLARELLTMPKEEVYARGDSLLAKKKWEQGRQFLRFVAENYANDPIGKQAALRLADSYYEEGGALGYVEAHARYKDFRSRYPSHPKADYALFRMAQCSDRQAESPDRDQTNTRLATAAYREIIQAYPGSPYIPEAQARYAAMRVLLADHEYKVAKYYLKRKAFAAARGRYDVILAVFPEYPKMDVVLYEGGLAEYKLANQEAALERWGRLAREFPTSLLLKKLPKAATAALKSPAPGAPLPAS